MSSDIHDVDPAAVGEMDCDAVRPVFLLPLIERAWEITLDQIARVMGMPEPSTDAYTLSGIETMRWRR